LARGSQGIYLFNYFDVGGKKRYLLNEMGSVESLADKDRSYLVTFVDINIPGKPIPPALPKRLGPGESMEFSLFIGPKPLPNARGQVELTLRWEEPKQKRLTRVLLNGHEPIEDAALVFASEAFREGYNAVRVANAGTSAMIVKSVELSLRFSDLKREHH
jgi:hypothetical protein